MNTFCSSLAKAADVTNTPCNVFSSGTTPHSSQELTAYYIAHFCRPSMPISRVIATFVGIGGRFA